MRGVHCTAGILKRRAKTSPLSAASFAKAGEATTNPIEIFSPRSSFPTAPLKQFHWFNELERVSATPELAERYIAEVSKTNIVELLPKVNTPTLVLHCKADRRVPFAMSQELAAEIPGAKFVPLEGKNHLFLAGEPVHRAFFDAVTEFLGDPPLPDPLPGTSSVRDRLDRLVKDIEQSWIVKVVIIVAYHRRGDFLPGNVEIAATLGSMP
jgi:hypothetical protein